MQFYRLQRKKTPTSGGSKRLALPDARAAITAFGIFTLVGLALTGQAVSWPMMYDDLHLIRAFSNEQLVSSLWGSWDPDGLETPGLRPFTLLFNHVRYLVFGENVVAHRLFLVVLLAAYLTLIHQLAQGFGMSGFAALAAGLVFLCAKHSIYHYTWISDGIHIVPGLAFGLSVRWLVTGLERVAWKRLALSLVAFAAGLLTREDMLAVAPITVLLGFVAAARLPAASRRTMIAYTACLIAMTAALMAYRFAVVPSLGEKPPAGLPGYFDTLGMSFNPMGPKSFGGLSDVLRQGWPALILLLLVSGCLMSRFKLPLRGPLLWLACFALACLPGVVETRTNLLFFPVTFVALFVVAALTALAQTLPVFRAPALITLAATVSGGFYMSTIAMLGFHPYSSVVVRWNSEFLYGQYAAQATIPDQRRQATAERLAAAGIRSADDMGSILPELIRQATNEQRHWPGPDGVVFVPLIRPGF